MPRYTPEQLVDAFYGPPPKPGQKKLEDLRKKVPKPERPKSELDLSLARELLGKDVFGPEEVQKAFGIEIHPDQIPPIPYSYEQLEKAKELHEMLVLRVDKDSQGKPLTMQNMSEIVIKKIGATEDKILYDQKTAGQPNLEDSCWYKDQPFFTAETSKLEWKLISKTIIPESTSKNYTEQTRRLRDYLETNQLATKQELDECSDQKLQELEALSKTENWQEAAKQLSELLINQNHRRSAVEAFYDTLLAFDVNDERLLENIYDSTNSRSSDGYLVDFGSFFRSLGASVNHWEPDDRHGGLGVVSSR